MGCFKIIFICLRFCSTPCLILLFVNFLTILHIITSSPFVCLVNSSSLISIYLLSPIKLPGNPQVFYIFIKRLVFIRKPSVFKEMCHMFECAFELVSCFNFLLFQTFFSDAETCSIFYLKATIKYMIPAAKITGIIYFIIKYF